MMPLALNVLSRRTFIKLFSDTVLYSSNCDKTDILFFKAIVDWCHFLNFKSLERFCVII